MNWTDEQYKAYHDEVNAKRAANRVIIEDYEKQFVAAPSASNDPLHEPEDDGCFYPALKMIALAAGLFSLIGFTEASGTVRSVWRHAWLIACVLFKVLCWGWLVMAIALCGWIAFCYWCRGVNRWQDRRDEERQAMLN